MNRPQRACIICLSPYRKEILSLHKQGVGFKRLYNKYATSMNYTATPKAFSMLIRRHIEKGHKEEAVLIPSENRVRTATLENFGQRMLELGMAKIDGMTPEDTQLKDVIQAQKLVLDAKKLKLVESSMELMLMKLFAPPELNVIEGELSDGTAGR